MALLLDNDYFKKKIGDILPSHLDHQFNDIATYLNNNLINAINTMSIAITSGIVGNAEAVFCNIADNLIGYSYLNNIHFDDNFLSLSKFQKIDKGSVLVSNTDGDIINITCDYDNQLIFGTTRHGLEWRKIKTEDLDVNLIDGSKLQILNNDNFDPVTFVNRILNNTINTINLQNITNEKIALNSVDFRHLGVFFDLPYNLNIARQVLLADFEDNAISSDKILDRSIKWTNFIANKPIEHYHIADNSIAHFPNYVQHQQPPGVINEANLADFGAYINFAGMPQVHNLQLTSDKLCVDTVTFNHFDNEVQAAITEYIRIKQDKLNPPPIIQTKPVICYVFLDGLNLKTNIGTSVSYVRIAIDRQPNIRGFYWWYMQWGDTGVNKFQLIKNVHEQTYYYPDSNPGEYFTFNLGYYANGPILKEYFAVYKFESNYGHASVYPTFFVFNL